jgi:hypothetical protein
MGKRDKGKRRPEKTNDALPAADAAMRKWRRRYEALRDDYEDLLDRIEELESRLEADDADDNADGRGNATRPGSSTLRAEVRQVVAAPWFVLRQEYAEAAQDIQSLVSEMDAFAHRSFKGQRGTTGDAGPPASNAQATAGPAAAEEARDARQPRESAHVQVHSPNLGALLDFQERLTSLPEVARVSMSQVNEDRAVLIVDLDGEVEAAAR